MHAGSIITATRVARRKTRNRPRVAACTAGPTTAMAPAPGQHFYYVRLPQDDGKLLWPAPVWVGQQAAGAPLSK